MAPCLGTGSLARTRYPHLTGAHLNATVLRNHGSRCGCRKRVRSLSNNAGRTVQGVHGTSIKALRGTRSRNRTRTNTVCCAVMFVPFDACRFDVPGTLDSSLLTVGDKLKLIYVLA